MDPTGNPEHPNGPHESKRVECSKDEETVISFEEAFTSLAFHLFPDGCPLSLPVIRDSHSNEHVSIDQVWPQPQNRAIVSAKEALDSLKKLRNFGTRHGFTSKEQDCLTIAACATLVTVSSRPEASEEERVVVKSSKLLDGSSRIFREILRLNLPKPGNPISLFAAKKLLAALRIKEIDSMGIICILHSLTLGVRNGALSGDARRSMSSVMYPILFSLATKADLCSDAVRLLHAITRREHVRVYRAQRLYDVYTQCPPEQQVNFAPLWLLLQFYAQYDPLGCGKFLSPKSSSTRPKLPNKRPDIPLGRYARWFSFPDLVWERNFNRTWHRDAEVEVPGTTVDLNNQHHSNSICKKQRTPSSTIVTALDRLADSFEGVQSFASGFGSSRKRSLQASSLLSDSSLVHLMLLSPNSAPDGTAASSKTQEVARVKVCLPFMLQQEWYHHSDSNASGNHGSNEIIGELAREEHDSKRSSKESSCSGTEMDGRDCDDENAIGEVQQSHHQTDQSTKSTQLYPHRSERVVARLQLLGALASASAQTDQIPAEAQPILLEEILRSWDGTTEWGASLCYGILPCVRVSAMSTFGELRSKVLFSLEKVFLHGGPKLQYAIVSGTLASLLVRLAAQSVDPVPPEKDAQNNQQGTKNTGQEGLRNKVRDISLSKRKMIKEYIHWVDEFLLQGFLSAPTGVPELLLRATIDFFQVVCHDVSRDCNLLVLPSTALVYRCLLTRSMVSIDRVCQLLVDYKDSFKKLKEWQEMGRATPSDQSLEVEGLDRVAVFNCLVWDFCSVLWRNSPLPSCQSSNNRVNMSILCADLSTGTLAKATKGDPPSSSIPVASITHGAIFVQYARKFLDTQATSEQEQGTPTKIPLSVDKLRGKMKHEYLDYLRKETGMEGLYAFLTAFIGSLSKRKKASKHQVS